MTTIWVNLSYLLIIFGIPTVILAWPGRRARPQSPDKRLPFATLTAWGVLILYRMLMAPFLIEESENGAMHDGIGDNLVCVLFGWLLALMGCVPALGVRSLIRFVHQRRAKRLAPNAGGAVSND